MRLHKVNGFLKYLNQANKTSAAERRSAKKTEIKKARPLRRGKGT